MSDISKITLPSGNTYDIKDATARQMISGGVSFIVAWDGTGTAVAANIPKGVVAGGVTGTLEAADAQAGAFYLVKSSTTPSSETLDIYDEYVVVGSAVKSWEKIGDTQLNLTDVVTGVSLTKQTDVVLGEATTFTAGSSSVTFTGNSTDKVLGEATTFTGVDPTITVTPTTTEIKATASGGGAAWNSKDQKTVVTGYTPGASNKDTFVKSVTAETGKNLVTTTITGTNGTESVSKVTKTASKLVTTTVPNVTANTSVTIPNVTSAGSASTWTFEMGNTSETAETLIISGANSTAPTLGTALTATNTTLGTAKTVATGGVASNGGGSDIITAVTISDKTVAKAAASATTVATGATSTTGTGDAVVTGVTVGESADALISLPSPSTATVIGSSSTFTNTQPTVKLTSGATAVSGTTVNVATGISSATASGTGVTVGTNDKVTAITGLGTGTAAAQTITVGTNDKVTVLKNTTDVSVTKGNS